MWHRLLRSPCRVGVFTGTPSALLALTTAPTVSAVASQMQVPATQKRAVVTTPSALCAVVVADSPDAQQSSPPTRHRAGQLTSDGRIRRTDRGPRPHDR
jgi:hypothetical protein